MSFKKFSKNFEGGVGFTLIELLIVMAILGDLAVVVLVAINPVQQLARTRDAGRKSGVAQLGRSLEAYYTAHGGSYIDEGATWIQSLVTAGEISAIPSAINPGVSGYTYCTANPQSNWCYDANPATGGSTAVIFTMLESDSEGSKCAAGTPWFVWSTFDGRGGLVCSGSEPVPAHQNWNTTQ